MSDKPTVFEQVVATGGPDSIEAKDTVDVEVVAKAEGIDLEGYLKYPNDNQGGN